MRTRTTVLSARSIDLDGKFGLHPGLRPFKELWDKKQLAIVEATGSPDPSRSHFDAQDYMESGTPRKNGERLVEPGARRSRAGCVAAAGGGALEPGAANAARATEAVALGNVQDFKISDQDRLAILKQHVFAHAGCDHAPDGQGCIRSHEDRPVHGEGADVRKWRSRAGAAGQSS